MKTLEVRASEGGADAEQFAYELTEAMCRAFLREGLEFSRNDTNITLSVTPSWL